MCYLQEGEFTCDQVERMYLHYLLYRESEEVCSNKETEIAITVRITKDIVPGLYDDEYAARDGDDADYTYDDAADDGFGLFEWASWYLMDENDKVVFNSTKDYLPIFISFDFQDTFFVDLCLPKSMAYKFVYQNPNQVGDMPVSFIEVMKDGKHIARVVEDDIGDYFSVIIPRTTTRTQPRYPKGAKGKGYWPRNKGNKGYMKGKTKGYGWMMKYKCKLQSM